LTTDPKKAFLEGHRAPSDIAPSERLPAWPIGLPDSNGETFWHDDLRLMREAGVNLVTVGIFSWAALQPAANPGS
jgi:beta-galactosidase